MQEDTQHTDQEPYVNANSISSQKGVKGGAYRDPAAQGAGNYDHRLCQNDPQNPKQDTQKHDQQRSGLHVAAHESESKSQDASQKEAEHKYRQLI